jgi:predicted murein hydrolase (TIGR00659 family)
MNAIWLFLLTVICFFSFKWLQYHCVRHSLVNPILLSIITIAIILTKSDINYAAYAKANQLLFVLLDLAVVSLAIPLYKVLNTIRQDFYKYLLCSCFGVVCSSLCAMLLAYILGANETLIVSLAPNAVTAPIAIAVSEQLNGMGALSAVVVICVGLIGAIFGLPILNLVNIKSEQAQGLALGAACHAIGTARAVEHSEKLGAFASLSLALSAMLTPLLVPIVYTFLKPLLAT